MRACVPVLVLGVSAFPFLAHAESLPNFLNSNDRERTLPVPNLSVDAYRPVTPALQVPTPPADATPLMMSTKVRVQKIRIEGGTVYPLQDLAAGFEPLIGREVSLADLIEATRGITRVIRMAATCCPTRSCRRRVSIRGWCVWCWWRAT